MLRLDPEVIFRKYVQWNHRKTLTNELLGEFSFESALVSKQGRRWGLGGNRTGTGQVDIQGRDLRRTGFPNPGRLACSLVVRGNFASWIIIQQPQPSAAIVPWKVDEPRVILCSES